MRFAERMYGLIRLPASAIPILPILRFLQPLVFGQTPKTKTEPRGAVFVKRWLELQTATLNLRYRFVDTSTGFVAANQMQHREALRGRVKLDRPARYTLNFGLFTGVRFTSGWNDTPVGIANGKKIWRSRHFI